MNIKDIAGNVTEREGIWFSDKTSSISYPEESNDRYFVIEKDSFWFTHRNECILEAVKKYSPDKLFADVGGGNGFVSLGLEANNINTVLIEPGKGAFHARQRGLKNVICSTLQDAGFKQNSIPAIGLFDVLEHIEDDTSFLRMLQSYLEPGGHIFITVPAYRFLWSNEDEDTGHFRRYSLNEITRKLKTCGFTISYSSYLFSFLPLPVFLFRTIPSRLGFNKKSDDFKKHANEHKSRKGIAHKIISYFLKREVNAIKKGNRISFGSSCIVVAKRH